MGLKTTPKGLNVNSPRWNLGFHRRRYKNGMRNSNQKKLPVNTLGATLVVAPLNNIINKIGATTSDCPYRLVGASLVLALFEINYLKII
jgi:hypothetical protein